MSDANIKRELLNDEYHVWHNASLGSLEAINWLQNDSNAPWTAMFYERHEPDILRVIGSSEPANLTSQAWMMNRLYIIFSSVRDAASFKLRFNAVVL